MRGAARGFVTASVCFYALLGCSSPEAPPSPEISAIVIDTYYPTEANPVGFTFADLFDQYGDVASAPYDVWTTNATGAPAALAWSDGSNAPDPDHSGFAHIYYPGPFERGVPYYVRVRGLNSTDAGAYAIRLLPAEPDPYTDYPRESSWYFASINSGDSAGEPVEGGLGVPTAYKTLTLNGKLNCYLYANEVDWFRFVLPP